MKNPSESEPLPDFPKHEDDHEDDVTNKIVLGATAAGLTALIGVVAWRKFRQQKSNEE
jgi:hypothetical protein